MVLDPTVFSVPVPQKALLKNVPIGLLEEVRSALNRRGIAFRVRYRGPRATAYMTDHRMSYQQHFECLKINANRFSVYSK
jgi:hypothetical protein